MKKVAYIILILLPIIMFSQNKWELTHNIDGQHPNNIEVIDSNYVNIFFSTGSNFKYIYNSSNQGKTWKLIYATNLYIDDANMKCIDSNNIFLGFKGGFMYYLKNDIKIIDTINIDLLKSYEDFSMYDTEIGIITNAYIVPDTFFLLVTNNRWKTYKKFHKQDDSTRFSYYYPHFKNDSIINCIVVNARGNRGSFYCEFNINSYKYELYKIRTGAGTDDLFIIDENHIFICGSSNSMSGGSCHDAIFKSSDGGKTWRRVLDFRSDRSKFNKQYFPPFGLQSIAFKDSLTGLAVGQFGKIVYTYDGGESWIYENKLHDSLGQPNTMKVRYAGSVPIIATYHGQIFRMIEDNLAPKAEDTITISGRVWEGTKGQPGIPIELGFRITMTDSNGYYKFTRVSKGKHTVKAKNKYHDGDLVEYYYKPFDYTPVQYDLNLTSDTNGIDFNAIDLRTFYSVSGEIVTSGGMGLKNILLTIGDSTTISTADGKFLFQKIEQKRTYELIPYSKEYKFTPWAYSINIDKDTDTFRFVATPITSVEESVHPYNTSIITPIPANDYITINFSKLNNELDDKNVEIYDVMGVLIESLPLINHFTFGRNYFIDISSFSSGVYFVKVGGIVEKFVKIK